MKMREFMNALDKTIDLSEAEQKIVEKSFALDEAPAPKDWRMTEQFDEIHGAIRLLRSRIAAFEKMYEEDSSSFDEETAMHWHYAIEELSQLKELLSSW
jgi:hypothetical protein